MALYDICHLKFNHIKRELPAGHIVRVEPAGYKWGALMDVDPLEVWYGVELSDEEHAKVTGRMVRVDRYGGRGMAHKLAIAEEKHWRGYEKPSKAKVKKRKAAAAKAAKVPKARAKKVKR